MRKIFRLLLVLSIILFTSCGRVTEPQARQALHNNLVKRYGEEFEIGYMGRRSDGKETWYQAEIYPLKYKGTLREDDKYYHSSGSVDIKKGIFGEKISYVGDLYREVLINESASEFYLPKLKELFGKNVLPVLEIDISELEIVPNFIDDYKKGLEKKQKPKIKGGIYIFGRVENDEDREWYRKQIYEFVQFMKQTGTFEYVSLDINILDMRILKDELLTNKQVALELKAKRNELTRKEFFNYRDKLYGSYPNEDESFKEKLSNFNKSELDENIPEELYQSIIFYKRLHSPKYIESNSLDKPKIEYNSLDDVTFDWEKF